MAERKSRSRRAAIFTTDAEAAHVIEAVIPISKELPITDARQLRTYRALIAEASRVLRAVLGWREMTIERSDAPAPPRQRGRVVGRSTGGSDAERVAVVDPRRDVMYTIRSTSLVPDKPFASQFASHVRDVLHVAMESAATLHDARTASATTDEAYELLVAGLQESIRTSFFRVLVEEPLQPLGTFMLGHRPFTAEFIASATLLRWIASVAATTYEGASVRTGIVLEGSAGASQRLPGVAFTAFEHVVPFMDLGGQQIALADGHRGFLVVRPSLDVIGLAWLDDGLEAFVEGRRLATPSLPVAALWVQAWKPELLRLFGSSPAGSFQFGRVRRGEFQLHDRASTETTLANLLSAVTKPKQANRVRALARELVRRAEDGHGTGVVIGSAASLAGRRPKRPIPITDGGTWSAFMGPDGAIVIDSDGRLVEYGAILPQPKRRLVPNRGTRHNALAEVSKKFKCVAVAVSDDGSLMVMKDGAIALDVA